MVILILQICILYLNEKVIPFNNERYAKWCRMYIVYHIYFENIWYHFTEFNMVQKLKYTNKVGVKSWQLFGQNKIRRWGEAKYFYDTGS